MQKTTFHRICHVSGLISAIALALLLIGTSTGRDALAWIYLQSTEAIFERNTLPRISPGQVGPDLPAVHVVQPNSRRLYESHTD